MKQRFESFIACPCKMPGNAMKRAVMMLLLCVLTATTAWAEDAFTDNGDGTYTINDAEGWGQFCLALQDNDTYNHFSDKTVYLGDDIEVSRMAGTDSDHDFCGTFDGQGHTLTFNYTATEDYAAPFRYVGDGCTIENLRVCGTINTPYKYAAGFIANYIGNVAIRNCRSTVTINSSVDGEGFHAGFIGGSLQDVTINIEGCAFTGSLLGTNTTHCAGFVGYNSGTLTISNSLFNPAEVTVGDEGSATFARGNAPTITKCYYTAAFGTAQGKQRRRIIAGDYVTVNTSLTGNYTTYNVSRIMAYTGGGLIYVDGSVKYYGNGDPVLLFYSHSYRAGYKFNDYTFSAGKLQGVYFTMPDEDVIVDGSWSIIDYSISYELNGGELPAGKSNPDSYTVETPTFTLCEPVKDRYVFEGWYTNDAFTGDAVKSVAKGSTGDMTLYAKWTPVTNNISVDYIDENGDQQTTMALKLDGSETKLTPGWYVVQGAVDFTSTKELSNAITLNGDVNLILADGAEMTVNNIERNGHGIRGNYTLTVFGQSAGTGRLSLTCGAWGNAIGCYNMVVNGGNITATNTSDGNPTISVNNLTINGGTVSATSVTTFSAISGDVTLNDGQLTVSNTCDADFPYAYSGNLTVNGGQFIASSDYGCTLSATTNFNGGNFSATNTNGAAVDGSMYLNWTSLSDRFYASSFNNISAEIAEGKGFLDEEGNVYQGYYVDDTYYGAVSGLDGKTLRPYGAPVELATTVTATTATLSWTGFHEEYNVRYKTSKIFLSEGFEGGDMPDGWTHDGDYWKVTSGTGNDDFTEAATGSYNAGCYIDNYDDSDKLITPAMDLSNTTSATLTFNFWNTSWGGDINTLNVYYSVVEGEWILLNTYDQEVSSWTPVEIPLEGMDANYQIIFECVGNYSYGMGIDDVVVAQNGDWTYQNNVTSPLTITGLTPNTSYLWQVQGILDDGETGWSEGTFTTTDGTDIALYNSGSEAVGNTTAIDSNDGAEVNVTILGRTLYKDGDWNTLCLPFNVTISGSVLDGDNVVAKVLNDETSELADGVLTLNFSDAPDEIPAGTPFIIKWDNTGEDLVNPVFNAVTINNTPNNVEFTGGTFRGNYAPLEITNKNRNDILLLSSGNRLGYAKTDRTIENGKALGACRAYFEIPANGGIQAARQFTLNFGDDEDITGIIEVNTNLTNKTSDAFDLQGRKVENPKKGLYIVNGKKVVIK